MLSEKAKNYLSWKIKALFGDEKPLNPRPQQVTNVNVKASLQSTLLLFISYLLHCLTFFMQGVVWSLSQDLDN